MHTKLALFPKRDCTRRQCFSTNHIEIYEAKYGSIIRTYEYEHDSNGNLIKYSESDDSGENWVIEENEYISMELPKKDK